MSYFFAAASGLEAWFSKLSGLGQHADGCEEFCVVILASIKTMVVV
jgi:hypothetical protein